MKLLKSITAWKRWMIRNGVPVSSFHPPTEFPCFGYMVVESFSYEEERPVYLYRKNIAKMAKALT